MGKECNIFQIYSETITARNGLCFQIMCDYEKSFIRRSENGMHSSFSLAVFYNSIALGQLVLGSTYIWQSPLSLRTVSYYSALHFYNASCLRKYIELSTCLTIISVNYTIQTRLMLVSLDFFVLFWLFIVRATVSQIGVMQNSELFLLQFRTENSTDRCAVLGKQLLFWTSRK